jgi:VanZ family protein
LFIAWIIYLANTGQTDVFPMNLAVLPHTDKLGHIVLYGILAAVLGVASDFRRVRLGRFSSDGGAFVATLFACLEEASQFLSPHRTPDALDLGCGFLGIWLAGKLLPESRAGSLRPSA